MIRTATLVCACVWAVAAAPAAAQSPKEQARELFKQGRQHYQASRFADALKAFEQANTLQPHPLMLYNIAQVQEAMEDLPAALATVQKYLEARKDDADGKEMHTRIQERLKTWGAVELTTSPPGATVYVNRRDYPSRGKAPGRFRVPSGRQVFIIELEGHQSVQRPVDVQPGEQLKLAIAMPPVLPTVLVRTNPPGARMFFDGRPASLPTPATQGLPPGAHKLRVELDGHEPAEREITLAAQHTIAAPLVVDIAFEKAKPKGLLALEVSLPGASVMIDGRPVGQSPLPAPLSLSHGLHKLTVTAPGQPPKEEMVTIVAGQTTRTTIDVGQTDDGGGGISTSTIAWGLVGVGGAALVGAAVTGALAAGADGDLQDCRDDPACERTDREVSLADDVRGQALITDILLGSGVAIAATGVALLLFADDGEEAGAEPSVYVVPTAEGGLAGGARWGF